MSRAKNQPHLKEIINRPDGMGNVTQYRITAIFGYNSWVLSNNAAKAHKAFDGVNREHGMVHGRWCVFVPLLKEPCEPTFKGAHLVYLP